MKWLALIAVALAVLASPRSSPASVMFDPIRLYGPEIEFQVTRNGNPVGFHRVAFRAREGELTVEARMQIAINFLFFEAYRYTYSSDSVWRDGRLLQLESRTDEDGAVTSVAVRETRGALRVTAADGREESSAPLYPTDHWNPGVLGSSHVINTITGRINDVTIREIGVENVPVGDGSVQARHFRYSGDLETEVWYDEQGRWVKMRFAARDGSIIEYICRKCGAGLPDQAVGR